MKKFLSVIMVVIMLLTAVPLSGFVGLELPDFDLGIKASALSSSGKCGDNVNYTYNEATGLFATLAGQITVPAATYTQDPTPGAYSVTPGISTLVVTGTI